MTMCKSLDNTATNIAILRKHYNLSRDEFAKMTGRTKQMVKIWESGKCSPNAETLFHIVSSFRAAYGITINLNEMVLGTVSL
ncbi:DNA-binding transcriptional regulator [Adlercreutzia sp. ZJ138]|uniref:helix-turn-helix domain-containing protein n=1 Tax=Adlercreutzia sp. ZJ138 TaxID=2709405 RepID=UPI0013EB610F|nr:helix-turn-helix domain-containing protein [Adlercreutzia sp. ZJ138]